MSETDLINATNEFENFKRTISKFSIGYNKGIVLSSVTGTSMEIINRNIELIKSALETVVTAFEEIRATSESTSENTIQVDKRMEEVLSKNTAMSSGLTERVTEIQKASKNAQNIENLFQDLITKSQSIHGITGKIHDVSERTNILAINASIEAARAGTVGKGFRIIANEVRKLAGQTNDFATDISSTINDFSDVVNLINKQMTAFLTLLNNFRKDLEIVGNTVVENSKAVEATGHSLSQISGAISEQTEALNDGLKSLENVFSFLKDSHSISQALITTHESLDTLLNREA